MVIPKDMDKIIEAALKVKTLREQLAQAEAELAHVSNATTTRGAPPAPAPVVADGLRDKIRGLLRNGKEMTTQEMAKALNVPQALVGDAAKRMSDLKRTGPGRYKAKKNVR